MRGLGGRNFRLRGPGRGADLVPELGALRAETGGQGPSLGTGKDDVVGVRWGNQCQR